MPRNKSKSAETLVSVYIPSIGLDSIPVNEQLHIRVCINGSETLVACDQITEVTLEVAEVLAGIIEKQKGLC